MNTHAIDLVQDQKQLLSIDASSQRGLDLVGDFTIEMWVRLSSLPSESNVFPLVGKHDRVTSTGGYEFYINTSNQLVVEYGDDDSKLTMATSIFSFEKADVGEWHHIAVVAETKNVNVCFYVDGEKQKSFMQLDDAKSIQTNIFPLLIGASLQNEYIENYFDGAINDLRIWSVARNVEEINENMKKQLDGNEKDLQAYWKFNEDVLDQTENKNTLLKINDPKFIDEVPFGAPQILTLTQGHSYGTFFG